MTGSSDRLRGSTITTLETERLLIRNFHRGDADALVAIITRYMASDLAAYDQPWPTSPEKIREVTAWFASGDNYLAVCLKETGQLIGFVALNPEGPADQRTFNLGYVFHFDVHGKGYASEACRALLAHAFEHYQAARVVTGTASLNLASCRLLQRLGFQKMGECITSFRNAPDGKPIQFLGYLFELSRNMWENLIE
ncbi:MAG: GNAT family N-acetyltransferase [Caldilineaceae bacterium]